MKVTVEGCEIDYALSARLSEELASNIIQESMVVAWYDGKKAKNIPLRQNVSTNQVVLVYADGHGGRVRVDINKEEYSFIFSESAVTDDK